MARKKKKAVAKKKAARKSSARKKTSRAKAAKKRKSSARKKTSRAKAAKKRKSSARKKGIAKRPPPPAAPVADRSAGGYEAHKERSRSRQAEMSARGRDIGEIPAVADPARRESCRLNLRLFCETYFAARFTLAWSDDHLRFIADVERAALHGELLAIGMPRGSGKTTLIVTAAIWVLLYGHRRFIAGIGADKPSVEDLLDSIQIELETNPLLFADFPEVCHPVRCLEGITQRANAQLHNGERTRMEWCQDQIILPTIPGSVSSGSIIKVTGITGRVRGMQHTLADGTVLRPDFVFIDDPQTDASAHSPPQNARRENVIKGAILGLAGPGKKIAGFATVTVIARDDLADRLLDRKRNPAWHGVRCKMVYSFPANTKLWDDYSEIYLIGVENKDDNKAANAFYRKHRKAMDAGAKVSWEERKYDDELSAIQHAMNLRIRLGDAAFFSEYQLEPPDENPDGAQRLTIEEIKAKSGGLPRGTVPLGSQQLVAYIDPGEKYLAWAACGFGESFAGSLIDVGSHPDQGRVYYTKRDAKKTLARKYAGAGFEGRLYAGLCELVAELAGRSWQNEAGVTMSISRILIDAAWGKATDVIFQFCRESEHRSILLPAIGKGIKSTNRPMNEWAKKPGDIAGQNWRIGAGTKRAMRHVLIDTNWWKSFVTTRIRLAPADRGSFSIFKASAAELQMLSDHLTAEYPKTSSHGSRVVDEWALTPGRENELWDCIVGCFIAASISGVTAMGHRESAPRKRKRIKLSEMLRSR